MKIQLLFDELKKQTENKESVFTDSGMINCYNKMQYGFFPFGLGILTENNKIKEAVPTIEVEEGGVMVLGNDFGTVNYVNSYVNDPDKKIGETDSKTIINFLDNVVLDKSKTFFTNFYLGVRLDDGLYKGTNMIKRMYRDKPNKLKDDYKKLCYDFFIAQLELVKPRIVICLGHEVKNALIDSGVSFHQWKPKTGSLEKLYAREGDKYIIENMHLKGIHFIVIPHPCYPVNLLKPPYLAKLNAFLESN